MKQASSGVYEITLDSGPAFFIRKSYLDDNLSLKQFGVDRLQDSFPVLFTNGLQEGVEIPSEAAESYLFASLCYSVEKAAMTYLARQEHCRLNLYNKLIKKGMDKNAVEAALDYLEGVDYLSDRRFAGAFLRSRSIDHTEGRIRLMQELMGRGIARNVADSALDEFFEDHDEMELCRKACEKISKQGKSPEKCQASLMRSGFSWKMVTVVMKQAGIDLKDENPQD